MNMLRLIRAKNGWIITEESHLLESELPGVRVFNTMQQVASFLVSWAGEKSRNKNGRFEKRKS